MKCKPKNKSKKSDPFFKREKAKYKNPIVSREFIIAYLEKIKVPESYARLARAFNIKIQMQLAFRRRLKAMVRDGQLLLDRKGRYALIKQLDMVRGYVLAHKDGYGFLVPEDGGGDLFLSPKEMRNLFPGDKVLASVVYGVDRSRREGVVAEVLERGFTQVVGSYFVERGIGFIEPSNKSINQRIIIPKGEELKAKKGEFVIAEIVGYPTARSSATAKVTKVLGKSVDVNLEVEIAINAHGLPHVWPNEVLKETRSFKNPKNKSKDNSRAQLQDLPFVTIDGADAKDFDDAVYCRSNKNNSWTLYVAIADVSHYVVPDTHLDQEALSRGNSVYFPNHVVPMLPEVLSNDICSLRPKEDRLVMVCEMIISNVGKITRHKFYEGVINSHARFTYDEVFDLLESKGKKSNLLLPQLKELQNLYHVLLRQRKERGALDFSRLEAQIIFDAKNKIKQIQPIEHHYVHGMIEECMLAANVSASKFLLKGRAFGLYRVHEGPNPERLNNVRTFLNPLGLELKGGGTPKASDYRDLLQKIVGRKDEHLVQIVMLRSMRQAVYTAENIGHFGLAFDAYVHFTSPIRRYPDLINHRLIKHLLKGGDHEDCIYTKTIMQGLGNHCSLTERRADDASRDVILWLKSEFMRNKVGKTFEGIISGVTNFGIFVELKDIFVEGLVHITSLKNDYYKFDALHHRLIGKRSGVVYRLGDKIKVIVAKVDVAKREIHFELS